MAEEEQFHRFTRAMTMYTKITYGHQRLTTRSCSAAALRLKWVPVPHNSANVMLPLPLPLLRWYGTKNLGLTLMEHPPHCAAADEALRTPGGCNR